MDRNNEIRKQVSMDMYITETFEVKQFKQLSYLHKMPEIKLVQKLWKQKGTDLKLFWSNDIETETNSCGFQNAGYEDRRRVDDARTHIEPR